MLPCNARLKRHKACTMGRVYFAKGFLLADYPVLHFAGVRIGQDAEKGYERQSHYRKFFADQILHHLRLLRRFQVVTQGPDEPGRGKVARLDVWISDLDEGSGAMRYMVGFESGSVDVQVEGRVVDAKTEEVVLEFADRRREAGNPNSGLNPTVFMPKPLIEKVLLRQANEIAKLLGEGP